MLRLVLIFAHLAGVVVWVGGMVFAAFCLRPAAAQQLEPPQRLPLWVATFTPFFRLVRICVAGILLSGFAMLIQSGVETAPPGWHVMLALGLVMAGVFFWIDRVLFQRLRRHSAAGSWPQAAAALNGIRWLVTVNLVLAVCTIAAAVSAR